MAINPRVAARKEAELEFLWKEFGEKETAAEKSAAEEESVFDQIGKDFEEDKKASDLIEGKKYFEFADEFLKIQEAELKEGNIDKDKEERIKDLEEERNKKYPGGIVGAAVSSGIRAK
ncbi:MAG: hypothetical protein IKZ06_04625, partial [Oscillospiraceae bacterium]|nr:hypothetical protein [Oscillospiraceae bacterium]